MYHLIYQLSSDQRHDYLAHTATNSLQLSTDIVR